MLDIRSNIDVFIYHVIHMGGIIRVNIPRDSCGYDIRYNLKLVTFRKRNCCNVGLFVLSLKMELGAFINDLARLEKEELKENVSFDNGKL